jgi:hypothetical protein
MLGQGKLSFGVNYFFSVYFASFTFLSEMSNKAMYYSGRVGTKKLYLQNYCM